MTAVNDSVVVAQDDLVIRRMRDEDAEYDLMVGWRNLPHVRRRWDPDHPPLTRESAIEEYRPDTQLDSVSVACIIELQDRPIGFIQFYRWASYPEGAREVGIPFDDQTYSLDVFIGVPELIGQGRGTKVVRLLSDYLINELGGSSVALTTDLDNHAAIKCYENAGFERIRVVLDTDTYMGERVKCWLMVKPAGRES